MGPRDNSYRVQRFAFYGQALSDQPVGHASVAQT
jgi:hypothetical protein